uniref:Ku_N domain-containing protein n=1 Tax=Caenorhabditis japonica TaxID=281687 RepID=A0A8R1E9J1_CAEJA
MPPKKSPGITAVLIDAGPNMAEKDEESGKSFFEQAINTADWIVSRKLFSEDPENFAIIAYNSDPNENIIVTFLRARL